MNIIQYKLYGRCMEERKFDFYVQFYGELRKELWANKWLLVGALAYSPFQRATFCNLVMTALRLYVELKYGLAVLTGGAGMNLTAINAVCPEAAPIIDICGKQNLLFNTPLEDIEKVRVCVYNLMHVLKVEIDRELSEISRKDQYLPEVVEVQKPRLIPLGTQPLSLNGAGKAVSGVPELRLMP